MYHIFSRIALLSCNLARLHTRTRPLTTTHTPWPLDATPASALLALGGEATTPRPRPGFSLAESHATIMLASRASRLPSLYALLAIGLVTIFLYYHNGASPSRPTFPLANYPSGDLTATNATLGFGGLWAVSGPGSPRRNHLEQAAEVTGLELTIPVQPVWTDEDWTTSSGITRASRRS